MTKRPEDMTREELEEEVAYLRREMGVAEHADLIWRLRSRFRISPGAIEMLLALYRAGGKTLNKSQLEFAVDAEGARDRDYGNIVNVYVCRIRKALGDDAIGTHWGRGFRLTPEGIALVDAALGIQPPEQQRSA